MKKIILFLVIFISGQLSASNMEGVKILELMVDTQNGDKLFVRAEGTKNDAPACSTNSTWQYVLPLDSELTKNTLTSLLLTAYSTGKKVRLKGDGACGTYNAIETLTRVQLK